MLSQNAPSRKGRTLRVFTAIVTFDRVCLHAFPDGTPCITGRWKNARQRVATGRQGHMEVRAAGSVRPNRPREAVAATAARTRRCPTRSRVVLNKHGGDRHMWRVALSRHDARNACNQRFRPLRSIVLAARWAISGTSEPNENDAALATH